MGSWFQCVGPTMSKRKQLAEYAPGENRKGFPPRTQECKERPMGSCSHFGSKACKTSAWNWAWKASGNRCLAGGGWELVLCLPVWFPNIISISQRLRYTWSCPLLGMGELEVITGCLGKDGTEKGSAHQDSGRKFSWLLPKENTLLLGSRIYLYSLCSSAYVFSSRLPWFQT